MLLAAEGAEPVGDQGADLAGATVLRLALQIEAIEQRVERAVIQPAELMTAQPEIKTGDGPELKPAQAFFAASSLSAAAAPFSSGLKKRLKAL